MTTTVLSSKGQVIIPNLIRTTHHWISGQKFEVIDTVEGLLLKPENPFPETTLEEVISCVNYTGPTKSLADMEDAIRQGAEESAHDRG